MEFPDKNALKELNSFGARSESACYFPSILDLDPEYAAESLSIIDSEETFVKLTACFDAIKAKSKNPYVILEATIVHSIKNYEWFCAFHSSLSKLVLGTCSYKYPKMKLDPKKGKLQVYPPIERFRSTPKAIKFRVPTTDPIDLHRVNYIRKDYEFEDFRDGFPSWYLLKDSVVFERYNEVTNVRVRIDFRHGEFKYYMSGASDNWKQIVGVPLEMDHVVSALLFHTRN